MINRLRSLVSQQFFPVLLLTCCLWSSHSAFAVFVPSGNGNTGAPGDDPGFANVGKSQTGGASVTYLGNGWVLTASHNAFSIGSDVEIGGVDYEIGSVPPIGGGFSANGVITGADLRLFRLSTSNPFPSLPSLQIASASPTVNSTNVTMIGNGLGHPGAPVVRQWDIVGDPFTTHWNEIPAESAGPVEASGFTVSGNRAIRWGNDVVSGNGSGSIGSYFMTTLNNPSNGNEAQAVNGDSGGAAFYQVGSDWYLAGIIVAQGVFNQNSSDPNRFSVVGNPATYGQPAGTVVYGNASFMVDLSVYRNVILSVVPEPNSAILAITAAFATGVIRRRRRRGMPQML